MSKRIFLVLVVIAVIVLIIATNYGTQFKEDNVGREVSICWKEVNVRENHTTSSEILTSLTCGKSVTLTGKSFEYTGGDGRSNDSWTEIQLSDGTIGWVVTQAIKR